MGYCEISSVMRIAKDLSIPIFPIDSGTCVIDLLISCGFETCLKNISLLFMEVINISLSEIWYSRELLECP